MKKILPLFAIIAYFAAVFAAPVWATTLQLTRIGGVLVPASNTTWTHNGQNPLLEGTASPSSQVNIKIGTLSYATVAAVTTGAWQFQPTTMTYGTYSLAVSSLSQSVEMAITTSSTSATASTAATPAPTVVPLPTALPKSGSAETSFLLFSGGLAFLGLGVLVADKMLALRSNKAE